MNQQVLEENDGFSYIKKTNKELRCTRMYVEIFEDFVEVMKKGAM